MDAHGRTFRVNLTEDGIARLRHSVKEKLKEFMGDYTDDTLVEYVIVLLKNGRQKEEARKELDVFLGDDTDSFVSWLWDHLTANSHLYMQPKESSADVRPRDIGTHVHQLGSASDDPDLIFDHEKETFIKSRTRHNREWKGLAHEESEPLILRSTLDDDDRFRDRHHSPIRKSYSPRPQIQRKRSQQDDEFIVKNEVAPRPKLDAPRRILQFAVRDAVRTVQKTSIKSEPSLKRLRSVVSSSVVDVPSNERPKRTRSVAIVAGAAAALKAVSEAAEDVVKGRGPGNVFDRLSHGSGRPYTNTKNQTTNLERFAVVEGDEDFVRSSKHGCYQQRNEQKRVVGDMTNTTMMDRSVAADVASDSGSENEDADNVGTLTRATERLRSAEICSSQMDKDIAMTQQSAAQTANDIMSTTLRHNPTPPPLSGPNSSQKTLNISINVNTWKPPHYQIPDQNKEEGNQVAVEGNGEGSLKLNTRVIKDNDVGSTPKKNVPVRQGDSNDFQKPLPSLHGAYPSGRPAEDADSRTVFISNVHFAATKDTLSRHFNKFGEVLKVIIVTDSTTGQPKGSAYVEFLRKESAELALSLNGTSFMSRILKVVTRNAAHHEAAALMSWPRIARSSAFPSRFSRMAYSRGLMPSNLRARLPLKSGPRSLQWKRDNPGMPANEENKPASTPSTPSGAAISPSGRNLTYVRPVLKTDGNVGVA